MADNLLKIKLPNGREITVNTDDSDVRRYSAGSGKGSAKHYKAVMSYVLETGLIPTSKEDVEAYTGVKINDKGWANIRREIPLFLESNNITNDDLRLIQESSGNYIDAREAAQNAYYRDIYSMEEGSTGRNIYDNMVQAEQNAAISNMSLADAQMQSAAMQQAQTVKSITDQIRAERMAKLRAGMSESQIANEDMTMLMNNINALNQQAADMNNVRLQAQQQYGLAQDTAYQQWLNNANTMGQTGAAMAAADAGDVYQQALRIQRQTGKTFNQALKEAQGKDE